MNYVDYTGDGRADFISSAGFESSATKRTWFYGSKSGGVPSTYEQNLLLFTRNATDKNVLKNVITGRGQKFSLSFDLLKNARPSGFETVFSAEYPYVNFSNTMRVVTDFDVDNGLGSTNKTTYQYGSARFHVAGRGFQGFGEIIQTDIARGTKTITDFYQDFPWSGMVESTSTVETASEIQLSRYDVSTRYPSVVQYTIGGTFCFYPKESTTTRYFPSSTNGILTASAIQATVTSSIDRNTECQVTDSTVVTDDETLTHTKIVSQLYSDGLPTTSTSNSNVIYKTTSSLIDHNPDSSDVVMTKTNNYNLDSLIESVEVDGNKGALIDGAVGSKTSYEYDYFGNPIKITIDDENESTTSPVRWTSMVMDSEGYFVETTYNSQWGSSKVVSISQYDALTGQINRTTDVNGFVTTRELNFLGAETSLTLKNNIDQQIVPVAYTIYDWDRMTKIQDGAPTVISYVDSLGRAIKQTSTGFNGSLITSETRYDDLGRVLSQITPTPDYGTQQSLYYSDYDVLGRPGSKTVDNGTVSFFSTYDYSGLTTNISVSSMDYTAGMSRSYNSMKQLLRTKDANGNFSYFSYNAAGLPVLIKDVAGSEITAQYDSLGRKSSFDDPNMGHWQFTYNEFGELATQIDARLLTTNFDYDALGRMTQRGTRKWKYDDISVGKGRLYQTIFDGKTETFSYDTKGRVNQLTTNIDGNIFTEKFAFDSYYGRKKGQQFASSEVVAYHYNNNGYLTKEYRPLNDSSEQIFRQINAMTALGGIENQTFGNGIVQQFTYRQSGAVSEICAGATVNCSLTGIQQLGYGYDSMGNLTRQDNFALDFSEAYTYDQLMRVDDAFITINGLPNVNIDYDYDVAGNMLFKTDYATNYLYGNSNRDAGGSAGPNAVRSITKLNSSLVSFDYDNNGNMTTGDGLSIEYNDDNKPTQIMRNGISSTFNYGADGMRYKQVSQSGATTTTTHYIGKTYERQTKVTGAVTTILDKTYLGGHTVLFTPVSGEFTEPSRIIHTLSDRLGGVDTLLDGSRHIDDVGDASYLLQQRRGYDIFGRPRNMIASSMSTNSFSVSTAANLLSDWKEIKRGFTGHEHLPESELIHMNGRIYDYNVGRFLGVDPFLQFPENSQSANPYSYIMNNPMAGTDPTGYRMEGEAGARLGLTIAVALGLISEENATGIEESESAIGNYSMVGAAEAGVTIRQAVETGTFAGVMLAAQKLANKKSKKKRSKFKIDGGEKNDDKSVSNSDKGDVGQADRNKSNIGNQGNGKRKFMKPVEDADARHTVWKTDNDGNVTNHQTFEPNNNPKNPSKWEKGNRTDVQGKSEYNKKTKQMVETPHTHDREEPGGIRPAREEELPQKRKIK